ncbi:MAG: universal stress protein, partial [Stellaceae bacterium]
MAYKDILVHLDGTPRDEMRLRLAMALATREEAHLTGLFALGLPAPALYATGATSAYDFRVFDQMFDEMRRQGRDAAAKLEADFNSALDRNGIEGEWCLIEDEDAAQAVARHARYTDLALVGQPEPGEASASDLLRIVETAMLDSGRPLIVLPYAGDFARIGETVLVGWKTSREAARALNDAIPLLRAAKSVTVLAINPAHGISGEGDVPAVDITHHLARHGVNATAAHT